jgi:hypothetical protein
MQQLKSRDMLKLPRVGQIGSHSVHSTKVPMGAFLTRPSRERYRTDHLRREISLIEPWWPTSSTFGVEAFPSYPYAIERSTLRP